MPYPRNCSFLPGTPIKWVVRPTPPVKLLAAFAFLLGLLLFSAVAGIAMGGAA